MTYLNRRKKNEPEYRPQPGLKLKWALIAMVFVIFAILAVVWLA